MSVAKVSFGVLQRVAEFLGELPEDQLADLAEGRARLAYVRDGDTEPAPRARATKRAPAAAAKPSDEIRAMIATIEALGSREGAVAVVSGLTTPELRAVGKALNIPNAGKSKLDDLKREIVDATVGRRLASIATRGFEGLRP